MSKALLRRTTVVGTVCGVAAVAATGAAFSMPGSHAGPKIDTSATLRIGTLASTSTLDPITQSGTSSVMLNLWDRLTTVDSKGNVRPMIALSWTASKDAKSITFTLRK